MKRQVASNLHFILQGLQTLFLISQELIFLLYSLNYLKASKLNKAKVRLINQKRSFPKQEEKTYDFSIARSALYFQPVSSALMRQMVQPARPSRKPALNT